MDELPGVKAGIIRSVERYPLVDGSDILRLGCSHPNAVEITALGDPAARYWCINPSCSAEYSEADTYYRRRYPA